ncbi:MAG: tetratricopeptide repeat protein [Prevotella sp.]|nr:tetratricopeptide repeat protein [Prevotella sp.]MBR0265594.1 tetratricopeptide repeat protein [Prevotella sp.]
MVQSESLNQVFDYLKSRRLGEAIQTLEAFLSVHPHQINTDRLFAIRTDYQLMADYWRRGFKDPQLPSLYENLLQRMYVLCSNIAINYTVRHTPYLSSLMLKAHMTPRDWSPQVIREELESFVSDIALADLEPEHVSEAKKKEIYARHHESMVILFDYILTSGLWTDGFATAMEEMLLSPTLDTNDQQLLISSVMLSSINYFDMAKFRMLVHVYQRATDIFVRQRALVGWVLALHSDLGQNIYQEEVQLVEKLLEDEAVCKDLVELQQQIIYCINAEADNAMIQQEIMPDLIKSQGFRITKNGVVEQEEDELNDILHPDETEKNMEKMEASFHRMVDMQNQGSDIYFGGFSQMKRFPFFTELANWFVPFYPDHPSITEALGKFKSSRFLQMMLNGGPFCNSDKYSFLLAFSQVINSIPAQVREMMDRGDVGLYEVPTEERQKPAYIRRIYLQDIYRFFRIFKQRDCFRTIFSPTDERYLFFQNPIFRSTHLEAYFNDMTAFLIKKKKMNEALKLLKNYGDHRRDFQYYMMAGYLGYQPLESYARALEMQPGNERAMRGYARILFAEERYGEALEMYDQLVAIQPEKKSYLLNRAVCQTNLGRYEEAEKVLFRLNYETPDDDHVNRVLAWALTCDGKYEQADHLYRQLLSVEEPSEDDLLNYGYSLWFSGNIDDAADCFHRYLKESGHDKEYIIENEVDLIQDKGITEPEIQMMLYIL